MTKNVYITGISGHIGSHLGRYLRQRRYFVTGIDIASPQSEASDEFHRIDIVNDKERLADSMAARDYGHVIHLAAIVAPTEEPASRVFAVNALGTYNVVQAAATAGAPKLIYMSSESVLGFAFSQCQLELLFAPITEEHPFRALDPYGSSKLIGERLASLYCDATRSTTMALRPPWVWIPEEIDLYLDLVKDPGKWAHGLWAYIVIDDLCSAVECAMLCNTPGYHHFFLAANDNGTPEATYKLLDRYYQFRGPFGNDLVGRDSVISSKAARRFLNWEPRWGWRAWLEHIRPARGPAPDDHSTRED